MKEPFSHEAFNFTKVRENECLAKYIVSNGKVVFLPHVFLIVLQWVSVRTSLQPRLLPVLLAH